MENCRDVERLKNQIIEAEMQLHGMVHRAKHTTDITDNWNAHRTEPCSGYLQVVCTVHRAKQES